MDLINVFSVLSSLLGYEHLEDTTYKQHILYISYRIKSLFIINLCVSCGIYEVLVIVPEFSECWDDG